MNFLTNRSLHLPTEEIYIVTPLHITSEVITNEFLTNRSFHLLTEEIYIHKIVLIDKSDLIRNSEL